MTGPNREPSGGCRPVDTGAKARAGTLKMELVPSILIAFSAGVYMGVLVMAIMFLAKAEDTGQSRAGD